MTGRLLYLARHGTMGDDAARRFVGSTDLSLAEAGIRQALWLKAVLAGEDIGSAHCSDLRRCRETAELILGGRGISLHPDPALREVSMGAWEGRPRDEIARAEPDRFRERGENLEHYRVPGGESMADCRDRIVPAIHRIVAESSGRVLVVAHAAVNRLFLCHALGMPVSEMFKLGQDPGCLNVLRIEADGRIRVLLTNFSAASLSVARQFSPSGPPMMWKEGKRHA